ncbi:MAG: type II toxin-antitoxin system RelE/ParE family toxin [Zoogloeaceae bacterium]|jgi:plasmid stabilization system protein ParE|nr:type II toxin-antitoxin system RelE/ParE family toxin [Zoogloeaceae bacterium]
MASVKWSAAALRDVQRLYRFLAPKNPDAARRAVKAIRQGVHTLTLQAGIGRPVEGMPEQFREWLIDFGDSGYVARYHIDGNSITVLTVWHQKEAGY